jgi:hypothetical protein
VFRLTIGNMASVLGCRGSRICRKGTRWRIPLHHQACAACVLGRRLRPSTYARGQVLTLGRSGLLGKRRTATRGSGSSGSRSNDFIKVADATLAHSGDASGCASLFQRRVARKMANRNIAAVMSMNTRCGGLQSI